MRPTLPSAIGRFLWVCAILLACGHSSAPPVTPAPALPAEPDPTITTMDQECDGLVAALGRYGGCPNLDDNDRAWIKSTIEFADQSLAAGKKGNPDEPSQRAIAVACHRAAESVHFATVRCQAGPRPRVDD